MSESENQLIHDLAKKYVFETFDFSNKSPEDLLFSYQDTYDKIEKIVEEQNAKIAEENLKMFQNFNF